MIKKTILFDLDGVLNNYNGKYDKNYIPQIKEGAYNFIKELSNDYKIVIWIIYKSSFFIFTTRNTLIATKWLIENGLIDFVENVTNVKEPAYLIIDDRCIKFEGDYNNLKEKIKNFNVWYKK